MERAFYHPERIESDAVDTELEHRLARIAEYGNRMLQVIVNVTEEPPRVVTVFFDRRRTSDETES